MSVLNLWYLDTVSEREGERGKAKDMYRDRVVGDHLVAGMQLTKSQDEAKQVERMFCA